MNKRGDEIVIGKAWRPVIVLIVLILAVMNLTPEQIELLIAIAEISHK